MAGDSPTYFERFAAIATDELRFLVTEHGFRQLDDPVPTNARSPQHECAVVFIKGAVGVVAVTEISGPIGVHLAHLQESHPVDTHRKSLFMLERLRCPSERLSPDERNTGSDDQIRYVIRHDARIIRKYFPDVLAGRVDLLSEASLEDVLEKMEA